MKNKNIRRSPSVLIVAIVAVVLAVAVTFASLFLNTESISRLFTVSNLAASADVHFAGVTAANMGPYKEANGIKASTDPTANNYIGKLRVSVNYKGQGVGLIRVRIVEEWSTTANGVRTVLPFKLKVPYTISNLYVTGTDTGNQQKWFDNRETDHRLYYATPVHCTSDSVTHSIPLIAQDMASGAVNTNLLPANTDVHIVVEADVVQVNRYPQYWGLSALPWTSGESLTEVDYSS